MFKLTNKFNKNIFSSKLNSLSKSTFFKNNFKLFANTSNTINNISGKHRTEYDTFGPIEVPEEKYWAAQTQRSLQNFAIGTNEDKMPLSVIRAMAIVKKAAAKVIYNYIYYIIR
jgi:hypothetical protein